MSRGRLLAYCIAGMFFFCLVFTVMYATLPAFRNGGHLFAGVILANIAAVITGLGVREIVAPEVKNRSAASDTEEEAAK